VLASKQATTLGAAALQSSAVNRATEAQAKSANNALDFQRQQWGQQQANQQPYLQQGQYAMQGLANGLGFGAGGNEVAPMGLINPTTPNSLQPEYAGSARRESGVSVRAAADR
jgi:hypothetical protein